MLKDCLIGCEKVLKHGEGLWRLKKKINFVIRFM